MTVGVRILQVYTSPWCLSVIELIVRVTEDVELKDSTVPVELSHCNKLADPVESAQFMFTTSPTEYKPN